MKPMNITGFLYITLPMNYNAVGLSYIFEMLQVMI